MNHQNIQPYSPPKYIKELAVKYKQSPPQNLQNKSLNQNLNDFEKELKQKIQNDNSYINTNLGIQSNGSLPIQQNIANIPTKQYAFRTIEIRKNSPAQSKSPLRVPAYNAREIIQSQQQPVQHIDTHNLSKNIRETNFYLNSTSSLQNPYSDRFHYNYNQNTNNNNNNNNNTLNQSKQSDITDKLANTINRSHINNDSSFDHFNNILNSKDHIKVNLDYSKDTSMQGSQYLDFQNNNKYKYDHKMTKKRSVTSNNAGNSTNIKLKNIVNQSNSILSDTNNGSFMGSDTTKLNRQQYQDLYLIEKGKNEHFKKEIQEFKTRIEELIKEKETYKVKYENEINNQKQKDYHSEMKKEVEQGEFNTLKQRLFLLEQQESVLKKEAENQKKQKEEMEELLKQAQTTLKQQEMSYDDSYKQLVGQNSNLHKEIQKLNCDLTLKDYDSKDSEMLKEQFQKQQEQIQNYVSEIEKFQSKLQEELIKHSDCQNKNLELRKENEQLQSQISNKNTQLQSLPLANQEKKFLENKVQELQTTLEVERQHLTIVTKNYEDQSFQSNKKSEEIIEFKSKISEFQDKIKKLEGEIQLSKKKHEGEIQILERQQKLNFQQELEQERVKLEQNYKQKKLDIEEQNQMSERITKENYDKLQNMYDELSENFTLMKQKGQDLEEQLNYQAQQNQGLQQTLQEYQIENNNLQSIQKQHTKIIGQHQGENQEILNLQQRIQELTKFQVQYNIMMKEYQQSQEQIQMMSEEMGRNSNETMNALHTKIRFLMSENSRLNNIILTRCKQLQQW